jgi:2-haloacid dehalogenase
MTTTMLRSSMRHAQLEEYFEEVLSTEMVRSYKPDPLAYRLGPDKLRLKKEEILFVAHAGWDAAGANWFGYPVFGSTASSCLPRCWMPCRMGRGRTWGSWLSL